MNKSISLTVLIMITAFIICIWAKSKATIVCTLLIAAGLMVVLLIDEIIKERKYGNKKK